MRNKQRGMSELATLWLFVAGLIVLVGGWILVGNFVDLGIASFVRPASTAIDNKVFHESQQYNDGMARRISEFKRDYESATDPGAKASIKAAIQVELGSYDIAKLPSQLQPFAYSMVN